jgi:diguanylate cyclase (GGDEF)-like protein/PAS domain S-box-containing protein
MESQIVGMKAEVVAAERPSDPGNTPSLPDPDLLRRQRQALITLARDETLGKGDLDSALELLTEVAGQTLECSRVRVWRRARGEITCLHWCDVASRTHAGPSRDLSFSSVFDLLADGACLRVTDLAADASLGDYAQAAEPSRLGALLAAPLRMEADHVDFVAFEQFDGPRRWRSDEVGFAQAIAGLMTFAIAGAERAETAAALKESEERFRLVAESMSDLVCLHDWQGRYLWVSPSCRRVLGYDTAELIGLDHFSLIHPDDAPRVRSSLWTRMKRGESVLPTTYRIRRKSGDYGWVETLAERIVENGDVVRLQTSSREVTERIAAEQIIAQSEERYRTVVSNTVDGIVLIDGGSLAILDANPAFEALVGYRLDDLNQIRLPDLLASSADGEALDEFAAVARDHTAFRGEQKYRRRDGVVVEVEVNAHTLIYRGAPVICAVARDITLRKHEEQLEHDRALALEHIATGEPASATLQHLTELVERHCTGMRCAFVLERDRIATFGPFDGPGSFAVRSQATESGQALAAPLFSAQGEVLGLFTGTSEANRSPSAHDLGIFMMAARLAAIAIDQESLNRRLEHQAHHDDLTGLPNRRRLKDRLAQALGEARATGRGVALLFIDLDRFKLVNDTLGHAAGDHLLTETAVRIGRVVRGRDTVARTGGDEFIVLAVGLHDPAKDGLALSDRIVADLSLPFDLDDREMFMTASVGIATYPNDGSDAEALVKHADTALYRAKQFGGNRVFAFTPDLHAAASARLELERDLRAAIDGHQLVVFYQPQFNTQSRQLIGMEALVRWQHPRRGLLSPADFLPLAEEIGLVTAVDQWVLREAAAQTRAWQVPGHPLRVSVNLSARHFRGPDIAERVRVVLDETGLDPMLLELELTETTAMETAASALETLKRIKNIGVSIAIDDFGTGYSSLSYLKRFPIDALKIDKAFVADVEARSDDSAIAVAIVAMARALKLRVVAEGVETSSQLQFLESLGCDEVQGFYLGRPLTRDDFERVLRDAPERKTA